MLKIYNTLTKKTEEFKSITDRKVDLYTCGPTVYHYAHIGNLRTFVFEDILKRVLEYNNYQVNHVMNITDVGHLTDDADNGEDKMEKGSKREGKTAWEIAKFYTEAFQKNLKELNIESPTTWCKATDNIPEQIALVQTLIDKGFTYKTNDGIYFDTTKLSDYGKLANLANQELEAGARVDMGEKKNPHDFALWKFSNSNEQRQMEWEAFGKKGFPGWHIECSAMSSKYLGHHFDIHCGGIDLIPVHHTNEIAQSEAAFDEKPWVNYWMHGEFIVLKNDEKMSKSGDNSVTLDTITEKGLSPLAYRFFLLQTHYRKQLNFSWEALEATQSGLENLREKVLKLKNVDKKNDTTKLKAEFLEKINDDLNTPSALALVFDSLKNEEIDYETVLQFDKILGLELDKITKTQVEVPTDVQKLLDERKQARKNKNWSESDRLRDEIKALGYTVEDTSKGQKIT
ncbi:MAG: cysteine--tRNA ligase [Candidatus Magasanikbacteria bacterium CG10_big_fil_rev_8_21_14_0_10_36_16]|uniref:Cysteine--tRNA ligase n=1 Tax=Candidatus Magasanikbacteria bacterium CG10_big_fil_rev_8_21_14_0_10_36_16 TaxID=1974645 RepID=A0A2H0TY65_9BACT|nr:MAG: cysteine--tRNA ligase [Candidatus Magasanikbacteria bacterium CG10_big_fil_rev_8_21_14_0_10_36_16]